MFLIAIEIGNVAIWSLPSIFRTPFSVAAAALSLLSTVGIGLMLYTEHIYELQPSSLLSFYLSLTMLFDIAKSRSYFLRDGLASVGGMAATTAALKLILVIIEEIPKRSLLVNVGLRATLGREALSGFWNRMTFFWLNPLFVFGFRNIISINDLEDLEEAFDAVALAERFEPRWATANKAGKYPLVSTVFLALLPEFVQVIVPRLMFLGLAFAEPYLIRTIVHAVGGNETTEVLGGIVGATVIIYFGKAVCDTFE